VQLGMGATLLDFNWTRFWVTREGHLLLDDDGFLADPEGKRGSFRNPYALPIESVLDRRCAVLLGEPGIGKSTELERVSRQGVSAPAVAEELALNLRDYSSDSLLVQDLFDNPKLRDWTAGSHELLLSLDSLDECMLRVETVASLLSSRLGRYPVDRLWLRIACRTAVWAQLQSLERALAGLWSPEQFGVFELLPLRRQDVKAAATASGIQPEAFLSEVTSRKAVPFVIKPLTLRFLLEQFRRDRRLPDRIEEIYLEGCRWLCTEANTSRVETGRTGKLSPDQRLAVAGRLAALTLFTGRTAILQGPPADLTDGDLSFQEALGGSEEENSQSVEITPDAIRETLDTGLFSARGPSRLGWAHQTYAEFLAVRYVIRHGFDTAQQISLVTHPGYSSRLVIPQLVQTAVCMVNINPPLFEELVLDSPHVLLRSEANAWNTHQRSELTASFLKQIADLTLTDNDTEIWRNLGKLDHPDLASQLEPYIRDRTANPVVRRVAIGVAEACRATQLCEALQEVALDNSDHQPTRVQAIRVLWEIGDHETRQRLTMLLATDLKEDVDDQIRGTVLSQAWPDLLSVKDLVQYLTVPKTPSLIGAYWTFLKYKLTQSLKPADIPQALAWADEQEGWRNMHSTISAAADNIVKAACEYIVDDATILVTLARVMEVRLKAHHSLWDEDRFDESEDNPLQDERKRHLLIQTLVERAADTQSLLRLQIIRSFREDDLPWLIQQVFTASTEVERKKWSLLVRELFSTDIDRYGTPVLEAAFQNKALAEALSFWIDPIALDSPEAQWQREGWQRSQKRTAAKEEEAIALASSLQQVDLVLQESGAGGRDVWWQLDGLLGDLQRGEWDADIRKYETWRHLDGERRSRVVKEAQCYILEREDTSDGSVSRSFNRIEIASFRALYLAISEAPDFCSHLSQEVVQKWTPITLRKPGLVDDEAEPYAELLRLASQKAPDLVMEKISQAIDEQNQTADANDQPLLDVQLQICWNEKIELTLIDKLREGALKPGFAAYLMGILLGQGSTRAEQWALQVLSGPLPEQQEEQERQIQVALKLVFARLDGWTTTWSRITALAQLEKSFADRIVSHLYNEFERGRFTALSGSQLGEIGAWLRKNVPQDTGSTHHGPAAINEIFRGQLFNYLQQAGTPEALYALQHMARAEPGDVGLKWMIAEAQQALLQQSWIPPEPATILEMARRPDSRLVDTGEQLLKVVVESLERLQRKLHGHSPLVDLLWNKWTDDKGGIHWRPKDEGSLSNFVKSHLEDDLRGGAIILNREVEIRRSLGKEIRQGQETDIQVDAIACNPRHGELHRISVIIEVKGCWNKELMTAMKEQLVDRYLAESDCRHGLYLVGWFLCDAWDNEDYRKRDTPKWPLQQAKEHFQEQAAQLSQGGFLIRSFILDAELR
jgi:hypothetical protein